MGRIRFIHVADVHLGSFLHITGELPGEIDALKASATLEAFSRVCDAALELKADFMVISGDLYDREARSVKASYFFSQQCQRLLRENIPVYVIAGNHDPLTEQPEIIKMPENLFVLDGLVPDVRQVVNGSGVPAARVLGQSYTGRSQPERIHLNYRMPDTNVWNIGLLHTQMDSANSSYVPCSLAELKANRDIHYWALGHIHKCRVLSFEPPVVAYPGIPQGRDFGEEGVGGCLLVEMDRPDLCSVSFIPTSPVIWKREEVFLDAGSEKPICTLDQLEETMCQRAEEIIMGRPSMPEGIKVQEGFDGYRAKGYIIRWVIRGRSPLHEMLNSQEEEASELLRQNLRERFKDTYPFLWTDSVVIRTEREIPPDLVLDKNPLYREIQKLYYGLLEGGQMKEELLRRLGQIWDKGLDHEDIQEHKFQMDDETYHTILESAKNMIIEMLLGRG